MIDFQIKVLSHAGMDNKIYLYSLAGSGTKLDETETSINSLNGIKLWKGKLYVTDDLLNFKVML